MKKSTLQWKVSLSIAMLLFFIDALAAVFFALDPNTFLWWPRRLLVVLFGIVPTIVIICASGDAEHERVKRFEKVFGFDPRIHKHGLLGDPQAHVSQMIRSLQISVQEIFKEEILLQHRNRTITGVDIRGKVEDFKNLMLRKSSAKSDFWNACNIARLWGFFIPKSINDEVIL